MAESMPYMNSTGLIPKILDKIKELVLPIDSRKTSSEPF